MKRSNLVKLRLRLNCAAYRSSSFMHKDKPPGIFALNERSMHYAAGFCFVVGFLLSVLVRVAVVLAQQNTQASPWQ